MKSILGALGMIGMLITVAIVLMLVARSWEQVAPVAIQVSRPPEKATRPTAEKPGVSPHADPNAVEDRAGGRLPDLDEMRRETAGHTEDVNEALRRIDE
jgi:hypothetical protein